MSSEKQVLTIRPLQPYLLRRMFEDINRQLQDPTCTVKVQKADGISIYIRRLHRCHTAEEFDVCKPIKRELPIPAGTSEHDRRKSAR